MSLESSDDNSNSLLSLSSSSPPSFLPVAGVQPDRRAPLTASSPSMSAFGQGTRQLSPASSLSLSSESPQLAPPRPSARSPMLTPLSGRPKTPTLRAVGVDQNRQASTPEVQVAVGPGRQAALPRKHERQDLDERETFRPVATVVERPLSNDGTRQSTLLGHRHEREVTRPVLAVMDAKKERGVSQQREREPRPNLLGSALASAAAAPVAEVMGDARSPGKRRKVMMAAQSSDFQAVGSHEDFAALRAALGLSATVAASLAFADGSTSIKADADHSGTVAAAAYMLVVNNGSR
jgi:hypothetical protein